MDLNLKLCTSYPSMRRRLVALTVFVFLAALASLIRFSRPDFGVLPFLEPLDFQGISPNFFVCFACPLLVFLGNEKIDIFYCIKLCFATAVGISVYEGVQVFMPNRTFDPKDILASFIGAAASVLLLSFLFLTDQKKG